MPTTLLVVLVLFILFISTFIRSSLGFGDALIAMPLLTLAIGVKVATPLVAFAASTIALIILSRNWRKVRLQDAWRLIVSSFLGIPIGLVLLKFAPEAVVKALLGVLIIAFGYYNLMNPHLPGIKDDRWAYVFGFIAGILGGAYNTNGPPAVVYGALRNFPADGFRATLQAYFFPTGLMILLGHGLAGLWTGTVLRYYLYALPVILVAIFLGDRMNHFMATGGQFKKAIYIFLIVVGLFLFI